MPRRRATLVAFGGIVAVVLAALGTVTLVSGKQMQEIKFDLGHDIVDTAKASGVPRFNARNVDGYISYSVNGLAPTVQAHYTRPGFEILWQPIFAFTMYGDQKRGRKVEVASLQLDKEFASDSEAQAFVEQTIAQFQKGKWQRYYDPTWDTLLTGRSSILDRNGGIESQAMTIDPAYKIEPPDWAALVRGGATWRWVGEGVLASLAVNVDAGVGAAPPTYRIDLDFSVLDIKLKQDEDNAAAERKKYDAMGKPATADYEKSKVDRLAELKIMEANALKRGDRVLVPH